jgi:hypothetical protein
MSRVGSLALALLEPSLLFTDGQYRIEQQLFGSSFHQSRGKIGQNAKVKAGIAQC